VKVSGTSVGPRDHLAEPADDYRAVGADSPAIRRSDSQWTLPVLVMALCLITGGSVFAHGSAATAWLGVGFAAVLGGVPGYLVVVWLRESQLAWRPSPATRHL
jgi:predicted signal transduction protein with EAL and GGDEF domain